MTQFYNKFLKLLYMHIPHVCSKMTVTMFNCWFFCETQNFPRVSFQYFTTKALFFEFKLISKLILKLILNCAFMCAFFMTLYTLIFVPRSRINIMYWFTGFKTRQSPGVLVATLTKLFANKNTFKFTLET